MRAVFVSLLLFSTLSFAQKFEGLAPTPPMGWNSWNHFACNVDEALIRATADAMVSSGMKDAGYEYVVIDDCWHGERDDEGLIRPDLKRFPSGMKALADYVHSRGLKLGIYSDAGWKTCGGRPGSRGYEFQDAKTYASWGIDYLKYDWCNTEGLKAEGAYLTMRQALRAAGRPIVFSICEWGDNQPWTWGEDIGHLWRTTGDITNCFDCVVDHGTWKSSGILQIVDKQEGLRAHAGPDHWNDPDMMEVGNGMSAAEDRAHFSLWAMLAAPLIAGNDLRTMSAETRAILTNRDVIAVDQDPLGIQGFRYRVSGDLETWARPLADGAWAVLFLNRGGEAVPVRFDWRRERIEDTVSNRTLDTASALYSVRDLWRHQEAGDTNRPLAASLASHDVLMFRLEPRRASPSVAAPKLGADGQIEPRFQQRHLENLARTREGRIGLLFLGDSITEGWFWGGNREIWDEHFGAHAPANFGIGGDRTEHLLWRIDEGELDGIDPRAIVLLIGTNNIGSPAEQIEAGVHEVIRRIRDELPDTHLLLLGIFPRGPDPADPSVRLMRAKIESVNRSLAALDDGDRTRVLDLRPRFVERNGTISPEIMPDALHLSAEGYRIWADAMKPILDEMMER